MKRTTTLHHNILVDESRIAISGSSGIDAWLIANAQVSQSKLLGVHVKTINIVKDDQYDLETMVAAHAQTPRDLIINAYTSPHDFHSSILEHTEAWDVLIDGLQRFDDRTAGLDIASRIKATDLPNGPFITMRSRSDVQANNSAA